MLTQQIPLAFGWPGAVSAVAVAVAAVLLKDWLVPLLIAWAALWGLGLVTARNKRVRSVALGSLAGLTGALIYIVGFAPP